MADGSIHHWLTQKIPPASWGSIREGAAPSLRLLAPQKIPPASEMLKHGTYPHYPAHDHHHKPNPTRHRCGISIFPAVGNGCPCGNRNREDWRCRRHPRLQDRFRAGRGSAADGGRKVLPRICTRRECREGSYRSALAKRTCPRRRRQGNRLRGIHSPCLIPEENPPRIVGQHPRGCCPFFAFTRPAENPPRIGNAEVWNLLPPISRPPPPPQFFPLWSSQARASFQTSNLPMGRSASQGEWSSV